MKKYPGSNLKDFKKAVDISAKLLHGIDKDNIYSPYSVIPLVAQILGLNSPTLGSGDSPYSIISLIPQMKGVSGFRKAFEIPLNEKRLIIDELYDMIAPLLLEENSIFIDQLINTRYKNILNSKKKIREFKKVFEEKFAIITPFMNQFCTKKGDFVQIVHYGHIEDLHREYDFLESLPKGASKEWFDHSYPMVDEITMRNFPDKKTGKTKSISGWVILIANSTTQLLEDGKLRKRKILQVARLAEKLGAKIIGMAGLIASFAQGGHWLSRQMPNIGFTTGHAYTIGNIMNIMEEAVGKVRLDIKRSVVAVVGAGGSIGSGCAELLIQKRPKELILIDISSFIGQTKLKETANRIKKSGIKSKVRLSTNLSDMKKADLIICATNSPHSIIKPEYLKAGAIVIDDSFPKNISRQLIKKRKDIIFLEGGSAQLPHSIDFYIARNAPDLMDAPVTRIYSCKEIYGCLAELLTLSLINHRKNYGLGYADIKLAKDIMSKSKRFGFSLAPLQCFDQAIDEKRVQHVHQICRKKYAK